MEKYSGQVLYTCAGFVMSFMLIVHNIVKLFYVYSKKKEINADSDTKESILGKSVFNGNSADKGREFEMSSKKLAAEITRKSEESKINSEQLDADSEYDLHEDAKSNGYKPFEK